MPKTDNESQSLKNLHITIIGAGPAGLVFARAANQHGAGVEVIERAGDPRGNDAGYTNRSFNLTINSVGRKILGDQSVLKGSTDVVGRAIHNFEGGSDTKYADFEKSEAALLTCIPRPVLRQNLVDFVEASGISVRFNTKVIGVEPDIGRVTTEDTSGSRQTVVSDLVVIADGIHSLADDLLKHLGANLNFRTEPLNYITVLLDKEDCTDLSLHHIHFWHQKDRGAVAIGLPNSDGTVAALLISRFEDVGTDESPFETPEATQARIETDFPELLKLAPDLPEKVLKQYRGRFYYKSISQYVLSSRCVVVGDAGSATPPWAGFGANTAIYSADVLAKFLVSTEGNIDQAIEAYQAHVRALSKLVSDYASEHGQFLSSSVAKNPEQRPVGPVLAELISQASAISDRPDSAMQ